MIDNKRCILIVDDEAKMVRALKDLFKMKSFYVLEAFDGQQALDTYCEYNAQIDLILLDVMMPVLDGFAVLKELRDSSSLTPVIMLTARGEEYDQLKGFKCGADDYIAKPFSLSLLLARVEAVLKRVGKDSSSEISEGTIILNSTKRKAFSENVELDLTKREFDLLFFFMINASITFSREQILNSVWGYEFEGDIRTIDTHIKQLRIKLLGNADYIKTIHRVGYRFEVQDESIIKK